LSKLVKIEYIIFFRMGERSIHNIISETFSATTKEEWLRAANKEMPENASFENLLWRVDGLTFSPYYTKEDLKGVEYLQSFHYSPDRLVPHAWLNMPEISVIDEQAANEKALNFLQSGAEGIVFDITNLQDPDIDKIINNINWNYCKISFRIADTNVVTNIFTSAEKKYDPVNLPGSLWWKHFPEHHHLSDDVKKILLKFKNYHLFGFDIPASSPVAEISVTLHQAVKLIDKMTDSGVDREAVFRSISLCLVCDENFLVNIAKLKAIRILWYQLSQSFEISDYMPADLVVRSRTGGQVDEKFQPHGNIIRNTCQTVSAIAGGCDEITIDCDDRAETMTQRVALNVSSILKEESHLDKVADPLAGSYAIENMVNEISQAAWTEFQTLNHEA
jgi:methylmalonyl-CoA mutase